MTEPFDFDQALKALQAGKSLTGKDSVLGPLIKQLTEAALTAELEQHLKSEPQPNRKNGTTPKTIKHPSGSFELDAPRDRNGTFELDAPRDRNGTFEPQFIKKGHLRPLNELDDDD